MSDSLDTPSCMEPGRAMLHQYVGRWFMKEPDRKPAGPGDACSRCGRSGAPLWVMDSGSTACIAQLAITTKRAGRQTASDPTPGADATGKFSMSDGTFAIAGPKVAWIITKLSPFGHPPPSLHVEFPSEGSISRAIRRLVETPPPPPFVAVRFAQKAGYPIQITTDHSRIVLNGPKGFVMDAPEVREAVELAVKLGPKRAIELAKLRERLASGVGKASQQEADRVTFERMRTEGWATMRDFRRLPTPGSLAARAMATIDDARDDDEPL